jgi:ligand-binding sensor domain-containing protein
MKQSLLIGLLLGIIATVSGCGKDDVAAPNANGKFWLKTNGPTGGSVSSLAINSSGHIFAGTVGGVFRSVNNGDSWTQVNTGLISTIVLTLAINSNGYIFAGTWGGVFRSVKSTN